MADFSKLPSGATLDIKPFQAHVSDEKLQHFKDLLKLSPIGTSVFENNGSVGRHFGMQRDWLANAKDYWLNTFDWRKHEDRFNSYPQFTAKVKDEQGSVLDIHFLALFSQKPDAVPLALYHGWPGSFVEFLDLVDLLRKKYTPQDLPYHIVVPSLPGYAYSSGPPEDRDYSVELASSALNNLMLGLGFSGYLVQGGDIGSFVSRILASKYDACKGMHVNMIAGPPPENKDELPIEQIEKVGLARGAEFFDTGFAYALEHGTRTGTIGLALSASPLAMLSWIGEKFLEWTDEDPPLDKILEDVTLYWLTDTFPRCIYPYRGNGASPDESPKIARARGIMNRQGRSVPRVEKPSGYSFFPKELFPMPKSWAATNMDLVAFARHESGGHFAVSREFIAIRVGMVGYCANERLGYGEAGGTAGRCRRVGCQSVEDNWWQAVMASTPSDVYCWRVEGMSERRGGRACYQVY